MTLRLDGPDCTLVLGPSLGYSTTRLMLEVVSDGRAAAVELTLTDARELVAKLAEWVDGYPSDAPPVHLAPSRAAMPDGCPQCGARGGDPCQNPAGRHLRRSHNGRRRSAAP